MSKATITVLRGREERQKLWRELDPHSRIYNGAPAVPAARA